MKAALMKNMAGLVLAAAVSLGGAAAADSLGSVAAPSNANGASSQPESKPSLAERAFGMLPGAGETNRIRSRVVGKVNGLRHGTRFTLENGQVWQQTEKSNRNYRASNPEVEIRQGFMNSYRMRLEGINARIRVRRVK